MFVATWYSYARVKAIRSRLIGAALHKSLVQIRPLDDREHLCYTLIYGTDPRACPISLPAVPRCTKAPS